MKDGQMDGSIGEGEREEGQHGKGRRAKKKDYFRLV